MTANLDGVFITKPSSGTFKVKRFEKPNKSNSLRDQVSRLAKSAKSIPEGDYY